MMIHCSAKVTVAWSSQTRAEKPPRSIQSALFPTLPPFSATGSSILTPERAAVLVICGGCQVVTFNLSKSVQNFRKCALFVAIISCFLLGLASLLAAGAAALLGAASKQRQTRQTGRGICPTSEVAAELWADIHATSTWQFIVCYNWLTAHRAKTSTPRERGIWRCKQSASTISCSKWHVSDWWLDISEIVLLHIPLLILWLGAKIFIFSCFLGCNHQEWVLWQTWLFGGACAGQNGQMIFERWRLYHSTNPKMVAIHSKCET